MHKGINKDQEGGTWVKKGLVMVYTGNGKGKTTAALGLAFRCLGHGKKVYMIQFMKGGGEYGEIQAARFFPNFTLVQRGMSSFVRKGTPRREDVELAEKGLELAREILKDGSYELVILDEINVAVSFGLLKESDVLELIDLKPEHVTMVLTGRYAPPGIIERADMVSEVMEVKHHYKQGITSQPGIEY